jgi:hypothetical protein
MTSNDQRSANRIPLDLRVHVTGPAGKEEVLLTHDLSARGIFLRTHAPPKVGTVLEMFTVVGAPARRVNLLGRVVRVRLDGKATHDLPPGVAVALDTLPVELKRFLEEASRRAFLSEGLEAPLHEAEVVEEVLLVGGDHPARERLARMLTAAGYAIAQADDISAAQPRLRDEPPPDALVLLAEAPETLALLALEPGLLRTSVVVSLGVLPEGLPDGFAVPVVMLPRMWPVGRLPSLLRHFAPEEQVQRRVLPGDELPPARAW